MPIESGTTLAQLDQSWPLGGDSLNQGDNHVRLIKQILKDQFPGALGLGFNIPITATEAELNYSSGVTSSIQTQINTLSVGVNANTAAISGLEGELSAPTGTSMVFVNTSSPSGWTFDASQNDRVLRVTSTEANGGATGGSWTIAGLTGGAHTLTVAQMPSHDHDDLTGARSGDDDNPDPGTYLFTNNSGSGNITFVNTSIGNTGGGGSHSHTVTQDGSWRPSYQDVIVCIKD